MSLENTELKESTINNIQSRREWLKNAGIMGASALASGVFVSSIAEAAAGRITPPQTEGPFYPVKDQVDKDADMTKVNGKTGVALGERITVRGQVVDAKSGKAVAGALVEFWQACATGRYDHPEDTNTTAALDPNFQYWSQVRTDSEGKFSVLTVKPGAYPADVDWMRPPHIHVKVHAAGYPSLTTQLYIKGEGLNSKDKILLNVPANLRDLVVVDFVAPGAGGVGRVGSWTIFIKTFSGSTLDESVTATPEVDD